jgi:hypothetical protein
MRKNSLVAAPMLMLRVMEPAQRMVNTKTLAVIEVERKLMQNLMCADFG